MKTQFIWRFISVFIVAAIASSVAQETQIDSSIISDKVTFLSASPNPQFAPGGIYAIPKPPFDNAPTIETWRNECLDGVTIRRFWKNLNPEVGVYDWKELDSMFVVAKTFSKKIHLIIAPGFHSPQWVLDKVETELFIMPRGPDKGEKKPLPLPWDETYLDLWFAFVDRVANRYGSNPALSLVAVTGPNSYNGEVNLPHEAEDIKRWKI